jgi:hypothetical protein
MAGGEVYVTFGGDTGALEASLASAKASVSAFTRELGQLAREQVKTGADAESALGQRMLEAAKHLDEAKEHVHGLKEEMEGGEKVGFLEGLNEKLEKLLAPIGGLKVSFGEMIELMAATFAVEQIADWVSETTEAAEKFEQMAAALGVTVEQAQQLSAVTKLAGGDVEEMTSRMEKLQLSLAKTGEKASPAAAALKALGINLAGFRGASITGQVDQMAEAFSRFADGSGKTAAAMALLGKTGADMIPFLDRGKDGLDELADASERTGAVMSEATIKSFAKTKEDLSELSLAWKGFSQELYGYVNQSVDAAARGMARFLEAARPSQFKADASEIIDALAGMAKSTNINFDAMKKSVEEFKASFESIVGTVASVAARILGPYGSITQATRDLAAAAKAFSEAANVGGAYAPPSQTPKPAAYNPNETSISARSHAADSYDKYQFDPSIVARGNADANTRSDAVVNEAAEALKQALFGPGLGPEGRGAGYPTSAAEAAAKPSVPQMDIGGAAGKAGKDTAGKDAEQQFAEEVQAAKDAEALIQEGLDERLKTHQITMAQWVAQSVAALDREQDAIQDAGDKAVASAGLTAQQKKAILLKEEHDVAEIALKEQKAFDKAFEEIAASAKSAADKIADAMNSQVDSLLRGKETMQQAFKNMAASMIEDAIKYCIKWAAEHAATVAMNIAGIGAVTAAQTTGTAIQTAAVVTGSSAVVGDVVAAKTAVVGSDAGQAAAGVAAWLAPFIGPAAIPAGAAAGATVGGIGMMDIGAWDVPQDQLAFVHKNELVATASQATGLRNLIENGGGGGGGDTHNYNTGGITVHNHGQPADGETLAKQYLAGLKRKGVFAGNSARRYAARA